MRVDLLTKEYPPFIYGGAGVHVNELAKVLRPLADVRVPAFGGPREPGTEGADDGVTGYPEIAEAFKRYAFEEAEHAAKFAELLGEVLTTSTKENLKMRVDAEHGACAGKKELATLAKQLNLDAIHDTVHEMCKDEARHGRGFKGLFDRYFGSK